MKELDPKAQQEVDQLIDQAYELNNAGKSEESFALLKKAWLMFPEPNEYPEAYNIARYNFEDAMKLGDLDLSKLWLNRMIDNNNVLHHSDEDCSFCVAKYHFEKADYKDAHELFSWVVSEAGNRYFEDEDPKYLKFFKAPEQLMGE